MVMILWVTNKVKDVPVVRNGLFLDRKTSRFDLEASKHLRVIQRLKMTFKDSDYDFKAQDDFQRHKI